MFLKVLTFCAIKENASSHTGHWADERDIFYQGDSRKLCWSRAAELSFNNLHTLISDLHISGTGGNLIRLVVLQEHSFILLFSFGVISKLCVREALWLICGFCLFDTSPVGLGENERSWWHWNGSYACKGRHECMHAVGFWHRKALARR